MAWTDPTINGDDVSVRKTHMTELRVNAEGKGVSRPGAGFVDYPVDYILDDAGPITTFYEWDDPYPKTGNKPVLSDFYNGISLGVSGTYDERPMVICSTPAEMDTIAPVSPSGTVIGTLGDALAFLFSGNTVEDYDEIFQQEFNTCTGVAASYANYLTAAGISNLPGGGMSYQMCYAACYPFDKNRTSGFPQTVNIDSVWAQGSQRYCFHGNPEVETQKIAFSFNAREFLTNEFYVAPIDWTADIGILSSNAMRLLRVKGTAGKRAFSYLGGWPNFGAFLLVKQGIYYYILRYKAWESYETGQRVRHEEKQVIYQSASNATIFDFDIINALGTSLTTQNISQGNYVYILEGLSGGNLRIMVRQFGADSYLVPVGSFNNIEFAGGLAKTDDIIADCGAGEIGYDLVKMVVGTGNMVYLFPHPSYTEGQNKGHAWYCAPSEPRYDLTFARELFHNTAQPIDFWGHRMTLGINSSILTDLESPVLQDYIYSQRLSTLYLDSMYHPLVSRSPMDNKHEIRVIPINLQSTEFLPGIGGLWTDPEIYHTREYIQLGQQNPTSIKPVHFNELKDRIDSRYAQLMLPPYSWTPGIWPMADNLVRPRKDHVLDLRTAIDGLP